MGNLIVGDISLQLIESLRPVALRIKRRDRSLADQLVRAASSVALNIAEADYSDAGNKRARLFTAAGSANETRAALRVAVAWGYCEPKQAEAAALPHFGSSRASFSTESPRGLHTGSAREVAGLLDETAVFG